MRYEIINDDISHLSVSHPAEHLTMDLSYNGSENIKHSLDSLLEQEGLHAFIWTQKIRDSKLGWYTASIKNKGCVVSEFYIKIEEFKGTAHVGSVRYSENTCGECVSRTIRKSECKEIVDICRGEKPDYVFPESKEYKIWD